MKRIKLFGVVSFVVIALAVHATAQNQSLQYFYDDLGRLIRVVDQNGNSATYNYDSVGNLLSISRSTVPANGGLAILAFSPHRGVPGQVVTIQGQGFSATASADTVKFNGTAATVVTASTTSLTVTVPTGAATGPISVATGGNSVSSDTSFTVLQSALVLLTVTPVSSSVNKTQTLQFTATGKFQDGSSQDMTSSVAWSSSNANIATISNSAGTQGLATGVSDGYVFITATASGIVGSTGLRVGNILGLTISPASVTVSNGASQQFRASLSLSDGTTSDVTASTTWTSSNTAIASISNAAGTQGLAAALSNGSTTISGASGNFTASSTLSVASLTSVTLAPNNPSIPKGATQQFTATAHYTDGSTKDVTNASTWNSSNSSVARISNVPGSFGFSTAVTAGTATVTATYGVLSGSTTITVTPPAPASITIAPSTVLLPPGGTFQLKAVAKLTDGTSSDVTSSATWLSSNPSVATVSAQGLASGIANGPATITAAVGNASGSASATVTSSQIYQGYVYAADGQTPAVSTARFFNRRTVTISDSATGSQLASAGTDANGFYQASGNPPSGQNVTVTTQMVECSFNTVSVSATATVGPAIVVNLTLPLAVVTGNVSYYDGTPVSNADVFVMQDKGCYGESSSAEVATADVNGNYHMAAELTEGGFTVVGEDLNSGLISSAPGSVISLTSPVNVNVQLPPTGTVSGSVFDANGNPVTQGSVKLYASVGLTNVRSAGLSGSNYQFTKVPVGPVVITASAGAAAGLLAGGGEQLNLNVNLQPTSTVAGTVFAADGVTPVASAGVTVENTGVAGIADFHSSSVSTNSSGKFSISNVPVGPVRVAATVGSSSSGVLTGTLTSGATLTLNPVIGNAVHLGFGSNLYPISDVNGFNYNLDCAGEPAGGYPGSNIRVFAEAEFPIVNSAHVPYFCESNDVAVVDQAGRQLTYGPRPMPGSPEGGASGLLSVGRKVFIPQGGGFARYLEILNNPLSVPITVTLEINNRLETSVPTLAADPSQNGNTFAVVVDTTQPSQETLGFVMGSGNLVDTISGLSLFEQAFDYYYTVTVPANQTVILMHFLIQRLPGDTTGAISQAQALVNLSDPNALTGMTAQEKAEVVNFNVH